MMSDSIHTPATMQCVKILFNGFFKLEEWSVPGSPHNHVLLRTNDSVACALYDVINDRLLLVGQHRPAMVRDDNPSGYIVECVAGRFDVNLGPKALAVKEAFEEAGVVLPESDVVLLNNGVPVAVTAGACTERTYMAYAEISPAALTGTDDEIRGVDGEGESIGRLWVPLKDLETMTCDCARVMAMVKHVLLQRALRRIAELEQQVETACDQLNGTSDGVFRD